MAMQIKIASSATGPASKQYPTQNRWEDGCPHCEAFDQRKPVSRNTVQPSKAKIKTGLTHAQSLAPRSACSYTQGTRLGIASTSDISSPSADCKEPLFPPANVHLPTQTSRHNAQPSRPHRVMAINMEGTARPPHARGTT